MADRGATLTGMSATYFFYDLETSGIDHRTARVMQFAGQRTDMDLRPISEPVNVLIKLTPDVLPDPDAIMITGITPQTTIGEGLTEAEFLRYFYDEVVTRDTMFIGYNSVRFDDEFMRFLHYRNFYDPYEWQWKDGCSRWDLLDVVRMTRALRPDGIEWPVTDDNKPTNRLELLTKSNGLDHEHAHDALSDVTATIAVAQLVRQHQPDLFKYLRDNCSKKQAAAIVTGGKPFVYTSGRYDSANLQTSVATMLVQHPQQDHALVYDLRHDPTPFVTMTPEQLADVWRYKADRTADDIRLPVKTLKYNRCPALAPLGVIKDATTQQRLNLSLDTITKNLAVLKQHQQAFATNILDALQILETERQKSQTGHAVVNSQTVDTLLYDRFIDQADKPTMSAIRAAQPQDIMELAMALRDERLKTLAPLYKARNYPRALSSEERQEWEKHVALQLFTGGNASPLAKYFARLQQLTATKITSEQTYLIEELQLYGQSIVPSDASNQDED